MLESFGVKNYRSFLEEANVELRPITLLMGKNSSGKSSLTRLIPLLQQSLDRRTASPILWNSDVIDFGDITNVITHDAEEEFVSISFNTSGAFYRTHYYNYIPGYYDIDNVPALDDVKFTARLSANDHRTKYHSSVIEAGGNKAEIYWSEGAISRLIVNGRPVKDYIEQLSPVAQTTNLFPSIAYRTSVGERKLISESFVGYDDRPIYKGLVDAFEYFVNKKTASQKRSRLARMLFYVPKAKMSQYLGTIENIVQSKLSHYDKLDHLSEALFIHSIPSLIAYVDSQVSPVLEGAAYLGPARASGARFYRYQELSVDRIDSRGENLAMYLSSLSLAELDGFNEIMSNASGYTVNIFQSPGHTSIELGRSGEKNFENLADVGFGFSQFLPIVAQIHAASIRRTPGQINPRFRTRGNPGFLMAIEQPELHLHPAFQSSLGDLFSSAIRHPDGRLNGRRFLIETHSETLVSRLSELIVRGRLSSKDVVIYFVEKDEVSKNSSIRVGGFSEDGAVSNWPIGFFTAES
jgi:hypothetical protein